MAPRRLPVDGDLFTRIAVGYGMARELPGGVEARGEPGHGPVGELKKLTDVVGFRELDLMTREQALQCLFCRLLRVEACRPIRRQVSAHDEVGGQQVIAGPVEPLSDVVPFDLLRRSDG